MYFRLCPVFYLINVPMMRSYNMSLFLNQRNWSLPVYAIQRRTFIISSVSYTARAHNISQNSAKWNHCIRIYGTLFSLLNRIFTLQHLLVFCTAHSIQDLRSLHSSSPDQSNIAIHKPPTPSVPSSSPFAIAICHRHSCIFGLFRAMR